MGVWKWQVGKVSYSVMFFLLIYFNISNNSLKKDDFHICWYVSAKLHSITYQKTLIAIITAIINWKLTYFMKMSFVFNFGFIAYCVMFASGLCWLYVTFFTRRFFFFCIPLITKELTLHFIPSKAIWWASKWSTPRVTWLPVFGSCYDWGDQMRYYKADVISKYAETIFPTCTVFIFLGLRKPKRNWMSILYQWFLIWKTIKQWKSSHVSDEGKTL
jgi:hypothetical protein